MTDNEIIEQIKVRIRLAEYVDNPYTDVPVELLKSALDLINRQKAEIEGLQKRIVFWREDMDYRPAEIKPEAIKDFAERVKMAFYYEFDELIPSIMANKIDSLVEEMAERKDNA